MTAKGYLKDLASGDCMSCLHSHHSLESKAKSDSFHRMTTLSLNYMLVAYYFHCQKVVPKIPFNS